MSEVVNPYAAPESLSPALPVAERTPFYVVSARKFTILFLGTAGLYLIYWMYKQWAQFKRAHRGDEWPVARAIFAVFFVHSLYLEVDKAIRARAVAFDWDPRALANGTVLAMIASTVSGRLASRGIGSPLTDWFSVLILFVMMPLLLRAQRAANAACGDPDGSANARLTAANVVWLLFGAVFWTLVVLGLFIAQGMDPF